MQQATKQRISESFRGKRDKFLRDLLSQAPKRNGVLQILDLGGRTAYWKRLGYDFLTAIGARVTVQNLYQSEIENDPDIPSGLFEFATGNACALNYPDKHFDFCHSNSVIEHVGLWRDMEAFARETRRSAHSYYVQTPNFWFPIEPHFSSFPMNHWLPRPVRAELMMRMNLATAGKAGDVGAASTFVDSARLLTKRQMGFLFPESELKLERVALLPKSIIAYHIAS